MQYDWNLGTKFGNYAKSLYTNQEWFEAAHFFSRAIELRPKAAPFYVDRANCYVKMKNWFPAEADCRKAIELDPGRAEAYTTLGLTLRHYGDLGEALQMLQKGLDLSIGFKVDVDIVNEARMETFKAKHQVWERESAQPLSELQNLKNACEVALKEKNYEINQIKNLDAVFEKAMEAYTPAEVPSFLCCPITLGIFRDPVITKNGISYERASILKSIARFGEIDPITRRPLDVQHLVPNLALRGAVENYLQTHGWAYKIGDDD